MKKYSKICSECNGKGDIQLDNIEEYLHKYKNDNRCNESYVKKQYYRTVYYITREPEIVNTDGKVYIENKITLLYLSALCVEVRGIYSQKKPKNY